jgi:hypothetical protein
MIVVDKSRKGRIGWRLNTGPIYGSRKWMQFEAKFSTAQLVLIAKKVPRHALDRLPRMQTTLGELAP